VDHREVRRCWDGNADAWTHLARARYDVCRDYLNTPQFLEILPDVTGQHGLRLDYLVHDRRPDFPRFAAFFAFARAGLAAFATLFGPRSLLPWNC